MMAALANRPEVELENTVDCWLEEARETGRADAYAGKRRWVRYTWQVPVTVKVLHAADTHPPQYAYTRDISRGGLGLKCRQPIEHLSLVRIMRDDTGETITGRVRYCTKTITGFVIGIEFEAEPVSPDALRLSA
ncbi:MAG TPA: PilZ domain-containing protein [Phycisphaerae bacterium]|nr:PilZ domain-containing protein [Phycisphaerae bacterium]